jgi:hypothetical protein
MEMGQRINNFYYLLSKKSLFNQLIRGFIDEFDRLASILKIHQFTYRKVKTLCKLCN